MLQVVEDWDEAKSMVGEKALLPTTEWTWPDTFPGERMGSSRWIETGMPEPRTKYGPFCARVGIASVAKRVRRERRLECIFFIYILSDIKSETPLFFIIKKRGDVEMKKVMEKSSFKKKSGGIDFFRKRLFVVV